MAGGPVAESLGHSMPKDIGRFRPLMMALCARQIGWPTAPASACAWLPAISPRTGARGACYGVMLGASLMVRKGLRHARPSFLSTA